VELDNAVNRVNRNLADLKDSSRLFLGGLGGKEQRPKYQDFYLVGTKVQDTPERKDGVILLSS
jgi:hypothetical protein